MPISLRSALPPGAPQRIDGVGVTRALSLVQRGSVPELVLWRRERLVATRVSASVAVPLMRSRRARLQRLDGVWLWAGAFWQVRGRALGVTSPRISRPWY